MPYTITERPRRSSERASSCYGSERTSSLQDGRLALSPIELLSVTCLNVPLTLDSNRTAGISAGPTSAPGGDVPTSKCGP